MQRTCKLFNFPMPARCHSRVLLILQQGMSTPYMHRGSISSGVYHPIDAHQSPSLQSPNITSSLTPVQLRQGNSMRLLGNSVPLLSKSSSGSLCNSETCSNIFTEASKSKVTATIVDKCGNSVGSNTMCTSPTTPHDGHNALSDVSISPHIHVHVTPSLNSESSKTSERGIDPECNSGSKSKKSVRKRRSTGEERSKQKSKLMAEKSDAKRKTFRKHSGLLASPSGSKQRKKISVKGTEVLKETKWGAIGHIPGKRPSASYWTSSDSEVDVLAEETASTESECLLTHSQNLRSTSPSPIKDGEARKSSVVKKAKKTRTIAIENDSVIAAENEGKKQVTSPIEKSQEDSDVAITTIKSSMAFPYASDGEREPIESSTIQPSVPNNSADDTIDQDVILVNDTQDGCYESGEGAETDCRPLTPEIPLQGNVPGVGSIPKETDETSVPNLTGRDGYKLLLSDTDSVVTLNKLAGTILTDTSEASTNRSIVEKKKRKRKNKAKGPLKEAEKLSITEMFVDAPHDNIAAPLTAQGDSSVSLNTSTSLLSSKTKEKKAKRKRKGCDVVESEIGTPVASKRMKLQNNEESSESVPTFIDKQSDVEQFAAPKPVACTETSESTIAGPSVLTNESEAPLPKKRRRKKNLKYADNFMDMDIQSASPSCIAQNENVHTPRKKKAWDAATRTKSEIDTRIASKRIKLQGDEESIVPASNKTQQDFVQLSAGNPSKSPIETTIAGPSVYATESSLSKKKPHTCKSNKHTDIDEDIQSTSHRRKTQDRSGAQQQPPVKKASDEVTHTQLSGTHDIKVDSSPRHPLHVQLGKSAALNKLLADAKHINTVKYLRSLFDVLLTANSSSTAKSSDSQTTVNGAEVNQSEVNSTLNHNVAATTEPSASDKSSSNASSPTTGVKPPPKNSRASLSLSSKGSIPAKGVNKAKTCAPSIQTIFSDTPLTKSKTPVVVLSSQTPIKSESSPKRSVKEACEQPLSKTPAVSLSSRSKELEQPKHEPKQTSHTLKNDDSSESETSSGTCTCVYKMRLGVHIHVHVYCPLCTFIHVLMTLWPTCKVLPFC